jgi:type IV pilus assembly protein PilV
MEMNRARAIRPTPTGDLAHGQRGLSMIEVLIALFIVAFGLLGIAAFQSRLQTSEMESYQRSQAIILLQDMVNRINTNRTNANAYLTATPAGVGDTPASDCSTLPTLAQRDLCEWSHQLQGAAELAGTTRVGAIVGARGCIEQTAGITNEYRVTVTWQGLASQSPPPASITCGAGQYGGGVCSADRCRRFVTALVRIAPAL